MSLGWHEAAAAKNARLLGIASRTKRRDEHVRTLFIIYVHFEPPSTMQKYKNTHIYSDGYIRSKHQYKDV